MKCGTTALQKFLSYHPDIAMDDTELNFFSLPHMYEKGIQWYINQMPSATKTQLVMEKSNYFGSIFEAAAHLYKFIPNVKMLLMVRNPIIRTISHFNMKRIMTEGFKNQILEDFIFDKKTGNILTEKPFIKRSLYFQSMTNWIKYFPLNQMLIIDGDNFIENPLEELLNVTQFLGIQSYYKKSNFYFNPIKRFYCYRDENVKECLRPATGLRHFEVSNDTVKKLRQFYLYHNVMFYRLTGKKFMWD